MKSGWKECKLEQLVFIKTGKNQKLGAIGYEI